MITQTDASIIQLDRAIKLFLDDEDYISAITLAGAAEGKLGELLKSEGKENAIESTAKGLRRLLFDEEIEALRDGTKTFEKSMINDMNLVKNWLKHHFKEMEVLSIDIASDGKEIAYDLIDRASTNYFQVTGNESEQMRRFLEYQRNEHS